MVMMTYVASFTTALPKVGAVKDFLTFWGYSVAIIIHIIGHIKLFHRYFKINQKFYCIAKRHFKYFNSFGA
jgi:hypothetical protein